MDSAGERFEAIRAALADRNNILTVKDLCELAGVSRSGYYNWVRSEKNRELREAKDLSLIHIFGEMASDVLLGDSSPLYQRLYDEGLINSSFGGGFDQLPRCV